jgi:hypothetical protein
MLTDEEWDALGQNPPKTPVTPTPKTGDEPEIVEVNDYEEVGGLLTYKGTAYTGAYNGKNYVNGRVVETPGDDIYETLNGVFQLNGKPYTGIYENKEYKDGIEVPVGSGNYETIGGIFTYKGTAYTGEYQGKKYVNGILVQESGEDKYEELNGVFTKNGEAYTGEYNGKQYVNGKIKVTASDYVIGPDGMLMFKGEPFTGEYQGKNYVDGVLKEPTDLNAIPDRPANVNKFYVYDKTTKTWVQPPKPQDGAVYSWDDNTGWVQETPGADKPVGTPAAYIYDPNTKTWVKPPMPTGDKKYTWDDTKGWVEEVVAGGNGDNDGGDGGDGDSDTPGSNDKPLTQKDIDDAVAAALAKAKTEGDAAAKAAEDAQAKLNKERQRKNTIDVLKDRFKKYGLESLAKTIEDLAVDGATEATITLKLQETDDYKIRFAANDARIKKDLTVLSPAEYLNAEDEYRQKLRDYGLKDFDNDAYVQKFIANDTSLTEISNRVVTAVQRVQNADPALIKQLNDFYGITSDRLVAYVLDPEQEYEKIKIQVSAGEIGVAAAKQGFKTGKEYAATAEQLARQGVTEAEAQKGYATIADILPTAEKLSSIYGDRMDTYGLLEGEQEVFNSLASAQRKRRKLSEAEIAQFSGSSGVNRGSLMDEAKGQF